jgi:hypothetical protein
MSPDDAREMLDFLALMECVADGTATAADGQMLVAQLQRSEDKVARCEAEARIAAEEEARTRAEWEQACANLRAAGETRIVDALERVARARDAERNAIRAMLHATSAEQPVVRARALANAGKRLGMLRQKWTLEDQRLHGARTTTRQPRRSVRRRAPRHRQVRPRAVQRAGGEDNDGSDGDGDGDGDSTGLPPAARAFLARAIFVSAAPSDLIFISDLRVRSHRGAL